MFPCAFRLPWAKVIGLEVWKIASCSKTTFSRTQPFAVENLKEYSFYSHSSATLDFGDFNASY